MTSLYYVLCYVSVDTVPSTAPSPNLFALFATFSAISFSSGLKNRSFRFCNLGVNNMSDE